ncbi:efflux RND transporter periplasmic adaptor subunit [Mucisphaera sp.]|uniref:efflux RND transporter periplasmic adaptor subunit n=1 Tax=Mucisphaera sp. TaxID=2913024 RepID=UPI003D152A68
MNPYKPRRNQPSPASQPADAQKIASLAQSLASGQPQGPEPPLPAARADLIISPQLYHGESVYVVKDPVGLTYYRLRPAEYYVLRQLNGHNNAEEVAKLTAHKFPDHTLSPEEVKAFVHQLMGAGLLLPADAGAAKRIRGIRDARRSKMRKAKLKSFLFIKVPLYDPDRFLTHLHRWVGRLMTRPFMLAALLFMLASAIVALANLQDVGNLAFPVLSWTNALLFGAVFLGIKVIHEIGHGLAAKHHGLEVHETGAMFMVFIPLFYVDTSDAWTLPDKRDRLWITAGGIFIEMLLAAAAVWIWIATDPGWVNQLAFNIMLAASITSLLFNANPLLRYDGYYFLMDWVEVPNLQAKSLKYLGQIFDRRVLRITPKEPEPAEAARMPRFFVGYATLAGLYRIIVLLSIVLIAWHLLDRFGLQAIGALLGMFALTTMILLPIWKGLKHIYHVQRQSNARTAWTFAALAIAALAFLGLWSIPVTETVRHPGIILAEQRQPIFTEVAGELDTLYVEIGEHVEAGQPIARLANSRLIDSVAELRVQARILEVQRDTARRDGRQALVASYQVQIDRIHEQITHGQRLIDKLTIRAPFTGRLHAKAPLQGLLGVQVTQGQALGILVAEETPRLALVVPQDDAALVQPGRTAYARLWAAPWREIAGTVVAVERAGISQLPHPGLAVAHGGEVDTAPGDSYNNTPSRPSVLAWIELDTHDPQLGMWWADGMIGRGRIETGQTRLGPQQWRKIRQALTLDWWI